MGLLDMLDELARIEKKGIAKIAWQITREPLRYKSPVMKIEMMLHFATVAGPFQPEQRRTSPAYTKFIKQLLRDGLVERPSRGERAAHPGWAYRATERGKAYVHAVCDVQLPIEVKTETTWGIPA